MGQSFSSSIQEEYADSSSATALHSKNRDETSAQASLIDENVVIHNDSSKPFKHKNVKGDEEHQSSMNTTSNSLDSTASIAPSARYNNTSSRCSKRSSSLSSHDDVDDQASMSDLSNKIPEVSLDPVDSNKKTFYYPSIVVTSLSDILKLTNSEIKTRLANTQFSVQGIREANNVIAKYNLCSQDDIFSWYQDQKSIHAETTTVVPCRRQSKTGHPELYNDQAREAQTQAKLLQERNHMKLALFVLKLSPQLKSVRFKMVPSKISESNFWTAVFYMLLTPNERENVIYGHAELGNHSDGGDTELKRTLLRKNREIVELQQQVMNLQQMLANLKQQHQQYQQQSLPMTLNNHCGKWIMDKESHEFLALDEEIKSKLRDGKKKRLEDVQEQMKFILDSDNVEDSRGRWDCCGKTSYESRCSCAK